MNILKVLKNARKRRLKREAKRKGASISNIRGSTGSVIDTISVYPAHDSNYDSVYFSDGRGGGFGE